MKKFILLVLCFASSFLLFAQEETLEDFYKISQENLNNYSLVELAGLDPTQDLLILKYLITIGKKRKKYSPPCFL